MAGRGGLNLTHSEPLPDFLGRYGAVSPLLAGAITAFPPDALRAWCEGLGEPAFVGSSGRVFPKSFKASPLLRAWRARLDVLGVRFRFGMRWTGWNEAGDLVFQNGETVSAPATLLALGGASWPRLGSDGGWVDILARRGIAVAPLRPANCGFVMARPAARFAGRPVKPVTLRFEGHQAKGELMLTEAGLEGGAIYALSRVLRDAIARDGEAVLRVDLRPGVVVAALAEKLAKPRGRQSLSTYLRKAGGLGDAAYGLLRASMDKTDLAPFGLAALIKDVPVRLTGTSGMERAISTAGGLCFSELDERFMLKALPGVFAAGEMLDWEAPTGGYLLQGAYATAMAAGTGMATWLESGFGTGRLRR